jgi:hypothetical protein
MHTCSPSCGCVALDECPPDVGLLNGLVQHSFGLQLVERRAPFAGWENYPRVSERFDCAPFRARLVSEDPPSAKRADHSPLAREGMTTLAALPAQYICPKSGDGLLPPAFKWADPACCKGCDNCERYDDPSLIFADNFDDERLWSINDFLVRTEEKCPARDVSQTLLELMAHKRSRLFGFPLANRFVNVLLPPAVLSPSDASVSPKGPWFMQPLVSFIRGGRERSRLRSTYSLTFFLVPIDSTGGLCARQLSVPEISEVVNVGWGFAAQPAKQAARFQVSGDLTKYLPAAARRASLDLSGPDDGLALREIIESVAFGVGLTLAQGRKGRLDLATERLIGNYVITSLGSARVSSVVVADSSLRPDQVKSSVRGRLPLPKPLLSLLQTLSDPIRAPEADDREARKYRLDRPFVDDDIYATAVLPTKRCLVVMSRADAQCGVRESALMQAGSMAYMTIGAATAIGTLRAIDNRLEFLDATDPKGVAEIDREIAADLAEIYDLDITRESYREMYRRLRKRLGIARDYETLQDKMQTLYQATSTLHERRTEWLLVWLTAAIVALSVLILFVTVING